MSMELRTLDASVDPKTVAHRGLPNWEGSAAHDSFLLGPPPNPPNPPTTTTTSSTLPIQSPPHSPSNSPVVVVDVALRQESLYYWQTGIRNWDRFFHGVYAYYVGGGLRTILLAKLVHLLTMTFVVGFATFLGACVEYEGIAKKQSLAEAVRPGCLAHLPWFYTLSLLLFAAYWLWEGVHVVRDEWPNLVRMSRFYQHLLQIPDADMQTVQWNVVVQKLVRLHHQYPHPYSSAIPVSAHTIVNRIMRKENYLIALFNVQPDLLDLRVPLLSGERVPSILRQPMMLTKVLEWHLQWGVLDLVLEEGAQGQDVAVRPEFLKDAQRHRLAAKIRRRLFVLGLLNLLLSPFVMVFLVLYHIFQYGQEFHKNPTQLSARSYTSLARWKFRHFNELQHTFQQRLHRSHPKATEFLQQFPQRKLAILAQLLSFVAGSLALSLTLFSVMDDDVLLNFHISPGRSVLWYIGLFGIVYTTTRSFVPDPHLVFNPEELMRDVIAETHYYPQTWKRMGLYSDTVRQEFSHFFAYRWTIAMEELLSVVLAPFIVWFSLSKNAGRIVDFFREFTVHVEGIGNVCSFAVFDFQAFHQARGVQPPASSSSPPASALRPPIPPREMYQRKEEDEAVSEKLESSILLFKKEYPDWQPSDPRSALRFQEEAVPRGGASGARKEGSLWLDHGASSYHSEPVGAAMNASSSSSSGRNVNPAWMSPGPPRATFAAPVRSLSSETPRYVPPPMPLEDNQPLVSTRQTASTFHPSNNPTPPLSYSGSLERLPLHPTTTATTLSPSHVRLPPETEEESEFSGPAFLQNP